MPQYLSQHLAAQIRTPRVSAGRDMSWGLSPGIHHGEQGNALFFSRVPAFLELPRSETFPEA